MLNKLRMAIRKYGLLTSGDRIVCAVSGGADSMALLWAMYLLKDSLQIQLSAAHFNHGLRGEESDRDEAFVKQFCQDYQIPLTVGSGKVTPGKKGLEAAAREARYGFFATLSGKIATAHTADDNAETVLMHLVRGTGLKGLGGIAPVNGNLIRPMLDITRQEGLDFLQEYSIPFVEDSTNNEDAFLRNRLRHHVMPLLKQENPKLAENVSSLAQDLRFEEAALASQVGELPDVETLRNMQPALRRRALAAFLENCGVIEPERTHVDLAEKLVFSENPSASANFPGNITIARNYDRLELRAGEESVEPVELNCPGTTELSHLNLQITCTPTEDVLCQMDRFTVCPVGKLVIRSRQEGDRVCLKGGTKSLKKLFIDRKIPANQRMRVPVLADDKGVLGVFGIGANLDRIAPGVAISWEEMTPEKQKDN
jgi:tRNA(Ile)-lysidine synthase